MKVSFANNTLVVNTEIPKEVIEKGISNLKATDDKDNQVYAVNVASTASDAYLGKCGITCNSYVDGTAAMIKVMNADTTLADVQRYYGEALLNADKYVPQILAEAAAKTEAIEAIFE